jgi:cytochrome c oxidase subunit 2
MMDFLHRLGLFPVQASTMAGSVDALFGYLMLISGFFGTLIASLIVIFAVRYRRRRHADYTPEMGTPVVGALWLEIGWTVIPFVISMTIFGWGASIYFAMAEAPADALEIFVVGRQWMWKLQHMEGRREIDELHVLVGRAVKLVMTSEDVIHSFYVPAFRVKADVLPNRYTTLWFEPTKEGTYHLFCAEYCGTQHSHMIGRIIVMSPTDYQDWLTGQAGAQQVPGVARGEKLSVVAQGERLFARNGCRTCHATSAADRITATTGPPLYGLYGRSVPLEKGYSVVAEEGYLRRSILDPMTDIVSGYRPMMPTYAGRLTEEDVLKLVAYIKSLAAEYRTTEDLSAPAEPSGGGGAGGEAPPGPGAALRAGRARGDS